MDRRVFVPLTHAEKRIYLTQQLHPESCLWNVPVSLRVTMADPDRLHRALLHVIQQTPGMRVVFTNKNGEPCKYLSQDLEPRVDRLDFTREGEQSYLREVAGEEVVYGMGE
ncbi:MAG: condensation domain-containing protein [Desulfovibrionales bacterium]